jgi:hypothetical protein
MLVALALSAGAAQAQDWPAWVLNPPAGELAAGECIKASGSMGLALAQQIDVKIEAMDQTYESRVKDGKAERLVSSFTSASKQMVSLSLQGARVTRTEQVKSREGDLLCVLVSMEPKAAEKLPGDVIRSAGIKPDDDTEGMLLARFKQAAAARSQPQS